MSYKQVWINGQVLMVSASLCRDSGLEKHPVDRTTAEQSGPVRHIDPATLSAAYLDDLLLRANRNGEHP